MNKLNQRSALTTFILLLIFSASTIVNADTIRIEFSGEFDDSLNSLGPVPDSVIESFINLSGQSFQGVIQIPNLEGSEPTEIINFPFFPTPIDRGIFTVTPDSFISISTGVSELDLFKETLNLVFIDNCKADSFLCANTPDSITFGFSDGEISTALTLVPAFSSPFESVTFPQVSVLQSLAGQVEIFTNDFSLSFLSEIEPFSFNVTIIQDEQEDDFLLDYLPAILSTLNRRNE